jgi:hypothetical protein
VDEETEKPYYHSAQRRHINYNFTTG